MKININLLPPEKKAELKERKIARFIIKLGLMAIFAEIVFSIFLFSSLKLIDIQNQAISAQVANSQQNKIYRKVKQAQETLKVYYERASELERNSKQQNVYSPLIDKMNGFLPKGIDFEYLKIENANIKVKGTADQRDTLLAFNEELKQSGFFEKIDFPISNLVQSENVTFEFSATIKKDSLSSSALRK